MPGFDGTGPAGMGPMTGGGRGFCSPWGIRTRAGIYSAAAYRPYPYNYYAASPFSSTMGRQQEIESLISQTTALKRQLDHIEKRIKELQK
ncbi:MAG: DUF5320 domain-containing protein [Dehalococcoidia bacterium]|nr:DUF5320 domain-containing protein [Dehalococcoidia bacterium]